MDDFETSNWTTFDSYYKGYHVKRSFPQDMSVEDIMAKVEEMIDAGFSPSWNEDTNKTARTEADPIMKATENHKAPNRCPMHGVETFKAKSGKYYHRSEDEEQICMGTGWFTPKQK